MRKAKRIFKISISAAILALAVIAPVLFSGAEPVPQCGPPVCAIN